MKILIVFGTRPEAIKLFPVVHALQADPLFKPIVCVTGQHRQMLDQVLELARIEPDYDLNLMRPDQTLGDITARIIGRVGEVIDRCQPDRIMVQGDTTTAMASALAAFYRRIHVDHVEAGLRSGDIYAPWPEEVNRKVVGSIAALHFAPTKRAAEALLRENLPADSIHITGNTVIDALLATKARVEAQGWVRDAIDLPGHRPDDPRRIILVTTHRRENFEGGIDNILSALARLAQRGDARIVFPVHPNPNVQAPVKQALAGHPNVELLPPLDYVPLVRLLSRCDFVLTDSGGLQEEAPALGKPVLVMRETTERPEGIDAGTSLLVGTDAQRILREAVRLIEDRAHYERMSRAHNPFGDGKAALRIRDILRAEVLSAAPKRLETLRHAS